MTSKTNSNVSCSIFSFILFIYKLLQFICIIDIPFVSCTVFVNCSVVKYDVLTLRVI